MSMSNFIFVITATTGRDTLIDTIESVQKQSYQNIKHIIVCDGNNNKFQVEQIINNYKNQNILQKELELLVIPWQTGKNNWICHRIYAAIPHLIVEDGYISYLDEDNYVDVNHYEILYNTLQQSNSQWAYSLRKIVTPSKEFVTYDMCESLGYLSHVWVVLYQLNTNPLLKETFKDDPSYYLIDTNCYLIEKSVLQKISYNFQRPARQHPEADRMLFDALRKNYKGQCTMAYTLNYRLDGRRGDPTDSAISEFYIRGNNYMNSIYNNNIPWKK